MLQQPHMLQAQAFPAQVVEKYAAVFHQSVVKPHHKFLPFLALPLCPTMLPCSMMNHTRTWVAQTRKPL